MGYAFVTLVRSGGDLGVVNTVLVDRGVLSPAAHMAWTGLAAAALWRAASVAWRGRAVAGFVGVYLLVAAVHTAWDAAGDGWMRGVLALVSLGLLTWTADRLAASDRRALPAGAQSPAVAGGAGNGGAPGSATG